MVEEMRLGAIGMDAGMRLGPPLGAGGGWTPARLFGPGDNGAWFPIKSGQLFQDVAATTPAGSGDMARYVMDMSGNGNHATEAVQNGFTVAVDGDGKLVLQSDGLNDRLQFVSGITGSDNHTVCYVGYGATASESIVNIGNAGTPYGARTFSSEIAIRTVGNAEVYDDANTSKAVVTHVLDGTKTGDNRAWKNGIELGVSSNNSVTTLATTSDPATIGFGSVGAYSQIELASLFVIDRALTDAEREQLEAYMAADAEIFFYDLMFMVGQSNMDGRATYDGLGGHASDTFQWGASGELVAATVPLQYEYQPAGTMGLDISFSEAWRAAHPNPLVFITGARGSTGFNDNNWNQGDTIYDEAIAKANAALAGIPGSRLRGILCVLGENDAFDGVDQATFAAALDAMATAMRSDIAGASNVPFVVGQIIVGSFTTSAEVKAAIADTPNRLANSAFADNTGLSHLGDGLHYDAASLRTLGGRMFTALDSLL